MPRGVNSGDPCAGFVLLSCRSFSVKFVYCRVRNHQIQWHVPLLARQWCCCLLLTEGYANKGWAFGGVCKKSVVVAAAHAQPVAALIESN